MKTTPFIASVLVFSSSFVFAATPDDVTPGYKEIPYYVNKLEATQLEDERVRFDKLIHDAVVNADLSSKKVVQEMGPSIEKIQKAMDSGLDRVSITGQTNWLQSAVDYFEREKMQPVVNIAESDWLANQAKTKDGAGLSTFPDKILINRKGQSEQIVEHTLIHEAVLSQDGRRLAYYRLVDPKGKKAEIWMVNVSNKKKKLIAAVDSCYTILFSLDGSRVFYQAVPAPPGTESDVFSISAGGGTPRPIAKAVLLQTVVEKGPYKGDLILYRKNLHHLGVSKLDCPYACKESGQNLGRIMNAACR